MLQAGITRTLRAMVASSPSVPLLLAATSCRMAVTFTTAAYLPVGAATTRPLPTSLLTNKNAYIFNVALHGFLSAMYSPKSANDEPFCVLTGNIFFASLSPREIPDPSICVLFF